MDVAETWGEVEVEEVGVGLAVTTSDDEGEQEIGIALGGDEEGPRAENMSYGENRNENEDEDGDGNGSGNGNGTCEDHELEEAGRGGVGTSGSGHGGGGSRRSSVGVSPVGSAGRSRSRSGSDSNSRSNSRSQSQSQSRSRSRSSVRGALEMESSVATSWTHADAEGERPSRDGDRERRPSDEAHYRSSADRLGPGEEVVDAGAAPREGTEVVSLSHLLTGTDGGVSRKEDVLVVQEEDIGEGWHPLQYNGKARSQEDGEGEGEKEEGEEDMGSVCVLESARGGRQSLEMNEKERWSTFGSAGRKARHLRLEFKPPSPQPWDDVDAPADNHETYTSDYYSTLNSKKFGTLQKKCVCVDVVGVLLMLDVISSLFHSRRRPLIPRSSYYFGPPSSDSAYGTRPVGHIGAHHPREIVRIERDYVGGELIQFSPIFPLELDGRVRGS